MIMVAVLFCFFIYFQSKEYKYNRTIFDQKSLQWTEKYACPGAKGSKEATTDSASMVITKV